MPSDFRSRPEGALLRTYLTAAGVAPDSFGKPMIGVVGCATQLFSERPEAKKLADATTKSLELELQLAQRRQARGPNADPTTVLKQDEVIRELERRTLEAQRQQAQAQKDLASKDEDIAKRRLDLYQAQAAATGSDTK